MRWLIRTYTNKGDVVFDGYAMETARLQLLSKTNNPDSNNDEQFAEIYKLIAETNN